MSALLDSLQAGFAALPVAAQAGRRAAMAAALADDLPLQRAERWKYTSLRALGQRTLSLQAESAAIDAALLAAIPAPRAVFVNGRFDAALSRLEALPPGLDVAPLGRDALAAEALLARPFERSDEVFARLNAALAQDGVLIDVAAGHGIEAALQLVFVGAPAGADLATHLRHRLQLGTGARLTVVEHQLASGEHRHLHNQLIEIVVGEDAQLRHARLQSEAAGATSILRTDARLEARAEYRRLDLELGAALSRHELNVDLAGEGARLQAGGALLGDGRRHVDTRLGITHAGRDTACELLWRGLARGRGRVVFHGGILIEAGADGSDANLSNKNLLLSEGAEIDSQPVLEIHADEVKAAHGATIGRLDASALFYLRSRGIPEAAARALLVDAFLREPLALLDAPALTESLAMAVSQRVSEAA